MTRHPTLAGLAALLATAALAAACTGGGSTLPTIPPATPAPSAAAPSASADTPMGHPTSPPGCPTEQPAALAAGETRTVTIATDQGEITIGIEADLSPIATGNFVALADCGYYDGVVFHRVVPGFVIQAGDGQFGRSPDVVPGLVGTGGPGYEIQDEPVTTEYRRGTVAMARTAAPNSVGSQFFIVLADDAAQSLAAPGYNNYQVIGAVTSGMETADAIEAAAGGVQNPATPVVMTDVSVATP